MTGARRDYIDGKGKCRRCGRGVPSVPLPTHPGRRGRIRPPFAGAVASDHHNLRKWNR